ncbi:hypothetical protein [Kineococcus aurantiacus]|uniref:TetR family transcriptional regulator n=1 Tax=Kineococcus aurantiacus TaxID=37633 RepID=A0A7Y9J0Z7_9ACTN|nr:hypothetical protein [Kineococcus aurantiacus]NYD22701.1 hypothetical protein [Kineococcus aurantiacus]
MRRSARRSPERPEVLAGRRSRRTERQALLVAAAVDALLREGRLTHEDVAGRTGLPLGRLRWAYPTTGDLALAAHPAPRTTPSTTPTPHPRGDHP